MIPTPDTEAVAREMVRKHDGHAPAIAAGRVEARLAADDVEGAIREDRVRRRVQQIEDAMTLHEQQAS